MEHAPYYNIAYMFYSKFPGTLNVYLNTTTSAPKLLWTLTGNKGNQWFPGKLPISSVSTSYQVYFEGIRGSTYTGDIGVDDVSFSNTACGCKRIFVVFLTLVMLNKSRCHAHF